MSDKHEVLLRMKAVELLAYWEGRVITNRLMEWFGISRQQASNDIKRYLTNHNPAALIYKASAKGYTPTPSFVPVITRGHIDEYLQLLVGVSESTINSTLECDPHLSAVQLPDRSVRPEVVRELLRACRNRSSLRVLYASMSNPVWRERVISPHTFVYTGFRWHIRAFCHKRNEFRDFILSRIDRTPRPAKASVPDISEDVLWNEHILLTIVPNPKLSDQQKTIVERDFGMPDGRLQISVRKALAHYTLQRYQAAISSEDATDTLKFPIILQESDRQKLKPYLFSSET